MIIIWHLSKLSVVPKSIITTRKCSSYFTQRKKVKSETKTKRPKKIFPGREDGGPSMRSKTAQENNFSKQSYADILKTPVPEKVIKSAQVNSVYVHKIKEFMMSQLNKAASINEFKSRKAAAQRSKEDIQKLNLQQWTTLKQSVKTETKKWKNSLMRNNWCNFGTHWKLDKLGLPRQIEKVEQPLWVQNRRKFLESLNNKKETLC